MSEHWSSPGGCHEDCPACMGETRIISSLKAAYAALTKQQQGAAKDALEELLSDDELEMDTRSDVESAMQATNLGDFQPALERVAEALSELGETMEDTATLRAEWEHEVGEGDCNLTFDLWLVERAMNSAEKKILSTFCATPLCEWEAVTERDDTPRCAQCAEAYDAGQAAMDGDRHAEFVRMFLATFAPYVERDEEIPGTFAVDRVVEFVKALQEKEAA